MTMRFRQPGHDIGSLLLDRTYAAWWKCSVLFKIGIITWLRVLSPYLVGGWMPTYRSFINASTQSLTSSPTLSANASPVSSSCDLSSSSTLGSGSSTSAPANRRLVLSLLLVTPSGTIQFPLSLPRNDPSRFSSRYQSSEYSSSRATTPDLSTTVDSSLPFSDGPSTPTFASDEPADTTDSKSMIFSAFSTAFSLFKSVIGSNSNMSAATVLPAETANVASPVRQQNRTLTWAAQANTEFLRHLEDSDDEDDDEDDDEEVEVLTTPTQERSYSVEQEIGRRGNGDSPAYKDVRPILKGSPKLLGWNVDEREEQVAWKKLMADAMESSVFDVMTEAQRLSEREESEETNKEIQSKKDLYQTWLESWEDEHVDLHWRVNVSLDGNHTWLLQPRVTGSALGSTALSSTYTASIAVHSNKVDAEVDTNDLVNSSHTEMSIQTEEEPIPVKSYSEVAIQAPEDPEVPIGALAPLEGEPTSLLHVGSPYIVRPGTPSQVSISSQPGTPVSRIPRRKESMASESLMLDSPASTTTALLDTPTESVTTQPTTARPTPSRSSTRIFGALRGSPSLKSLSLKRQPSTISTKGAAASGTVTPTPKVKNTGLPTPVEESPPALSSASRQTTKLLTSLRRQPSLQSTKGTVSTTAPPLTPESTDAEDASSVTKPKNARFFSAVKRLGRTNSAMQAWKP